MLGSPDMSQFEIGLSEGVRLAGSSEAMILARRVKLRAAWGRSSFNLHHVGVSG